MPITLGCQSCGKRFRARDESAGKRVKCPFCAAPVMVPTAEESATAGAATAPIPTAPPRPAAPAKPSHSPLDDSGPVPASPPRRPAPSPPPPAAPAPVASAADWGAKSPPAPPPEPAGGLDFPKPGKVARVPEKPKPAATKPEKTPEQLAVPGWRKMRAGLFWVSFALFWLCIPALAGTAKVVCAKAGVAFPKGAGFISIPGVLNEDPGATFQMDAEAQIDALAFGVPVFLAGLMLVFGRLTCAAAPRVTGAKGMFVLSSLFTLLTLAGLLTGAVCFKVLNYEAEVPVRQAFGYAAVAFVVGLAASEFWFLTGLAASGATLGEPRVTRAVGSVGFFAVLTTAWCIYGWPYYAREHRGSLGADVHLYEQIALTVSLLLLIIVYWRPVKKLRRAIREYLDMTAA